MNIHFTARGDESVSNYFDFIVEIGGKPPFLGRGNFFENCIEYIS